MEIKFRIWISYYGKYDVVWGSWKGSGRERKWD